MTLRGIGYAVLAMASVLGATAHADETVIVRGQVTAQSGADILFGQGGAGLVGQSFYIVYGVFDTSPGSYNQAFDFPYQSSISGGGAPAASPVLASVTVGAVTFDDAGQWTTGEALRQAPPSGQSRLYYEAQDANWRAGGLEVWTDISSATDPFVSDPDYRHTLLHPITAGDLASGGLSEAYQDPSDPSVLDMANLTLTPASIYVLDTATQTGGDPPGAPEPAAWALIAAGVGAVGARLRRQRVLTS